MNLPIFREKICHDAIFCVDTLGNNIFRHLAIVRFQSHTNLFMRDSLFVSFSAVKSQKAKRKLQKINTQKLHILINGQVRSPLCYETY